eukprot:3646968-Prorocentrum_lima.AAC.1
MSGFCSMSIQNSGPMGHSSTSCPDRAMERHMPLVPICMGSHLEYSKQKTAAPALQVVSDFLAAAGDN